MTAASLGSAAAAPPPSFEKLSEPALRIVIDRAFAVGTSDSVNGRPRLDVEDLWAELPLIYDGYKVGHRLILHRIYLAGYDLAELNARILKERADA